MAALEFCLKHNMVAYLEKTDGNAEFHEIIDFLTRSSIHYALTVSPVASTTFVEQFWMTAKSKTINNVRYITATVAGKPVSILEASIRSDLQFNNVVGIDVLPNQAIFDTIQLMGYKGDLNTLTFNKGLFFPQWKILFQTIIHCLSSKSKSWDQIPTNIATVVICLATNQVYNFSKLILMNVPVPLDHFPINALTMKVFSFMVKKGKKNSGNMTPLFPSMLAQPTEDEGEVSERPSETQPTPSPTHPSINQFEPQSDPSLRPSSSNLIPNSIPEGSSGNHGGQSSSDRSISGNEDDLTLQSVYDLCVSLCKQGRKPAKSEPTVHKDLAFDDFDDPIDYIETEDAHNEGRTSSKTLEFSLSRDTVVLEEKESAEKRVEGTTEIKDQVSDESATPTMISTPTPIVFGDDETIAQVLITISQNKIDPKDKGKKVLEEEAESDAKFKGVNKAERKFAQLANDEEIARKYDFIQARLNADKILAEKLQEEERENFTIEQSAKFLHDTIVAQRLFLAQQRSKAIKNKLPTRNQLANENFILIGSAKDEKLIEKMNKKADGMDKEEVSKEPESTKVKAKIEEPKENIKKRSGRRLKKKAPKRLEDGTEINILAERRYPLTKNTLERMMDLRLKAVSDNDTVFDLLRFIKQMIDEFGGQDGSEKDL
ncbi:hypothetical protein Tco_1485801 [Tanacetum coccineum]